MKWTGGWNGMGVGMGRRVYTCHSCHTQVQGRLWLDGALMTAHLRLLKYLEWHLKNPAVLTKGLRVSLSWYGGDSLIEKAAVRTNVTEGAHWH